MTDACAPNAAAVEREDSGDHQAAYSDVGGDCARVRVDLRICRKYYLQMV
jgi:hypothetical protein